MQIRKMINDNDTISLTHLGVPMSSGLKSISDGFARRQSEKVKSKNAILNRFSIVRCGLRTGYREKPKMNYDLELSFPAP